jgi:2-pyrone-4,6-dicarboxylate lactonase
MPFRAIIVPAPDLTDSDLDRLHQQGVRGIRYILAHPGGLDLSGLERDADRCRARGWHLEFLAKAPQLIELEDRVAKLSCPVSFDHFAFINPSDGVQHPAFQALLRLLSNGNTWAKFSGAYRAAGQAERYDGLLPMARVMVEVNPDRIVWGSDWPHVGQKTQMPKTTPLLNLLQDWAPSDELRRKILADNATALYGFD